MSSIFLNSVSYYYSSPADLIFDKLTINISCDWKLGLIGRNGMGKTTLLNMINKTISPTEGTVFKNTNTYYFPYKPINPDDDTLHVIKENIAPYSAWENKMELLLKTEDEKSLEEYGVIFSEYENANGYAINSMIEKEFHELRMDQSLLKRAFSTLSGGEQTRALLISLFLKKNSFPLIDEPTNHLDMKGRSSLGDYLKKKKGFILVSHDRYFLDLCVDHILSINKSDVSINKGNYTQWKYNADVKDEFEKRKKENLLKEVKTLEVAAKKHRSWSFAKEKEKHEPLDGRKDTGFIGHKSAKLMKRALHIESRINKKLEEKKLLLKNYEKKRQLKIETVRNSSDVILSITDGSVKIGNKTILNNFYLTVRKSERIAVIGDNGSGKTTLFKIINRELDLDSGELYVSKNISMSYARQEPKWSTGNLRDYLNKEDIDETRFRNILGVLGTGGDIFERPLETFSKGEIKKVELCKSFIDEYDLLIWDEPLNYVDLVSREQLEKVILDYRPTMIFTEHDRRFIENTATDVIPLN